MEAELRGLLEKPGEAAFAGARLHRFLPRLNRLTGCSRSPQVQRGAAAGGGADAEAEGDRGRQERRRGGPGRGPAQVSERSTLQNKLFKITILKNVVFVREEEEDQQLNEMMQNLGESPTMHQCDILQLLPDLFLPVLDRSQKSQRQTEILHLQTVQTEEQKTGGATSREREAQTPPVCRSVRSRQPFAFVVS